MYIDNFPDITYLTRVAYYSNSMRDAKGGSFLFDTALVRARCFIISYQEEGSIGLLLKHQARCSQEHCVTFGRDEPADLSNDSYLGIFGKSKQMAHFTGGF